MRDSFAQIHVASKPLEFEQIPSKSLKFVRNWPKTRARDRQSKSAALKDFTRRRLLPTISRIQKSSRALSFVDRVSIRRVTGGFGISKHLARNSHRFNCQTEEIGSHTTHIWRATSRFLEKTVRVGSDKFIITGHWPHFMKWACRNC